MSLERSRRSAAGAPGLALLAALLLSGCGTPGASAPATSATQAPTPSVVVVATPTPTPEPTPSLDPSVVVVSAFANIFGAGHEFAPAPAGGGEGIPPPAWPLPAGERRIVTFPMVEGEVYGRLGQAPPNGPAGEDLLGTDVESFGGISGIVHGEKAMFLVGVFLTDEEPADPAPERLDFTDNEDFDPLEPEIAQVFLVGDGIGHRYLVPPDATRLFLGFAEGMFYMGPPGYYRNNSGELVARVAVSVD